MRFKALTTGHGRHKNKETFLVTLRYKPRCDDDITFIPRCHTWCFYRTLLNLLLHYKFLVCVVIRCLVCLHNCILWILLWLCGELIPFLGQGIQFIFINKVLPLVVWNWRSNSRPSDYQTQIIHLLYICWPSPG